MSKTVVKSPYDLIRRVFTFRLPAKIKGWKKTGLLDSEVVNFPMATLPAWLDNRTRGCWPDPKLYRLPECRALLKAAGPGGGLLEAIYIRRVADGDEESSRSGRYITPMASLTRTCRSNASSNTWTSAAAGGSSPTTAVSAPGMPEGGHHVRGNIEVAQGPRTGGS
jgi:hypothetical protein